MAVSAAPIGCSLQLGRISFFADCRDCSHVATQGVPLARQWRDRLDWVACSLPHSCDASVEDGCLNYLHTETAAPRSFEGTWQTRTAISSGTNARRGCGLN